MPRRLGAIDARQPAGCCEHRGGRDWSRRGRGRCRSTTGAAGAYPDVRAGKEVLQRRSKDVTGRWYDHTSVMNRAGRFRALAVDYDDTLASNGGRRPPCSPGTAAAQGFRSASPPHHRPSAGRAASRRSGSAHLRSCRRRKRRALLYRPKPVMKCRSARRPGQPFIDLLRRKQVTPLSIGRVIVATRTPQEVRVLKAIKELGLELEIIFNKGAVMVLPSGVNKASGLRSALHELKDPGRPRGRRRRCRERSCLSRRLRVRRRGRERRSIAQGARQARDERLSRRRCPRSDRTESCLRVTLDSQWRALKFEFEVRS